MAKSKSQKESDLAELTEKVKAAKSVVVSGYRGTAVKDIDTLREAARQAGVFVKVYKITLINKVLGACGIAGRVADKQPVVLAVSSEDEVMPARIVKGVAKEVKTLTFLGGLVDGRLVSGQEMESLADLPGKQELRGQLVRAMNGPVSGLVNVLAGNIRGLINVLNAIVTK